MRKQFLSMVAIAGMTLLASCSNDENLPTIDNGNNGTGSEITLSLSSGGSGMETRAGRPVNSSAAANEVDRVQLKLYKSDNGLTGWTEVNNALSDNGIITWSGPTDEGVPGTTDHEAKKTVKLKNLEASSHYKIVAYGYKGSGEKGNTCTYTLTDTEGTFTTNALSQEGENGANIEEIFAGNEVFETGNDKKITTLVEVKMNRMVAGMLGYFKNIPVKKAKEDGTLTAVRYVRVYTVAKTTQFTFPSADDFNGAGTQNETLTKLLEYDMQDLVNANTIAEDYQTQVNAATEGNETFNIDAKSGANLATVENSILAGRFIIPFKSTVAQNTLSVQLEDVNGVVLRKWDIKVNNSSLANPLQYDIKRNHFYSIGKKLKSDDITGGNGENPDPETTDPDTPVDLSQDNDIIVILNDAWDVVYDMGLGD